ncbi:UNVERIFIED_CONTAM: hypothetical protein BEN50_14470 [Euhalothece sp. KZN 001]
MEKNETQQIIPPFDKFRPFDKLRATQAQLPLRVKPNPPLKGGNRNDFVRNVNFFLQYEKTLKKGSLNRECELQLLAQV